MSNLPASLMTEAEARVLVEFATHARVLELGAWHGVQTARMAKVATVVWSVDRHTGDVHTGPADTLAPYRQTLDAAGVTDKVVTVVADFVRVFNGVRPGMFDLIVIDGEHTNASLLRDWYLSLQLVATSGTIAVHDWGRYDTLAWLADATGMPNELHDSLAIFYASMHK